MKFLPKFLLALTAFAALSFAYPASVQAVPTTYQYTGNPFTDVTSPYTTSDFVTLTVTLTDPLGSNMPFTSVTPIAFSFSDGVRTLTDLTSVGGSGFAFETNATGDIIVWNCIASITGIDFIRTLNPPLGFAFDEGDLGLGSAGSNMNDLGQWSIVTGGVPDTGSTLLLMMLTLIPLGLAARRFQRAAV